MLISTPFYCFPRSIHSQTFHIYHIKVFYVIVFFAIKWIMHMWNGVCLYLVCDKVWVFCVFWINLSIDELVCVCWYFRDLGVWWFSWICFKGFAEGTVENGVQGFLGVLVEAIELLVDPCWFGNGGVWYLSICWVQKSFILRGWLPSCTTCKWWSDRVWSSNADGCFVGWEHLW